MRKRLLLATAPLTNDVAQLTGLRFPLAVQQLLTDPARQQTCPLDMFHQVALENISAMARLVIDSH